MSPSAINDGRDARHSSLVPLVLFIVFVSLLLSHSRRFLPASIRRPLYRQMASASSSIVGDRRGDHPRAHSLGQCPSLQNDTLNLSPSCIITNIASNINFVCVSLFKLYLICIRSLSLSLYLSHSFILFLSLSLSHGQWTKRRVDIHASLRGAHVSALIILRYVWPRSQRVYFIYFSLVVESFGSLRKICSEI